MILEPKALNALYLGIGAFTTLIMCFSMVISSLKSKQLPILFSGVIIGIAGLILAIFSVVKGIKSWQIIAAQPETYFGKGKIILAFVFDGVYAIFFLIIISFLVYIFIGYRRGL